MARYLYSELSSLIQARANCLAKMDKLNPNAVSASMLMGDNEWHKTREWKHKHEDFANQLVEEHLPSGSGFDSGTKLDWDASHAEKLVFTTAFHHMDENGYYDGWTEHTVTVTPSLAHGFHMRISGRNRNDIKEYIGDTFREALDSDVEWDIVQTWPSALASGVAIQTRWIDQSKIVLDVVKGTQAPKELVKTFDSYDMWDAARACAVETVKESR
jgi:hypothetical protein